jgi:hypothetical protein
VLAAVERIGDPTLLDLSPEFPDLAPSALARVLDALEQSGRTTRAGDPGQIYAGGVRFWSISHKQADMDPALADLTDALSPERLPYDTRVESERRTIVILIPVSDLSADLLAGAPALDVLRQRLAAATAATPCVVEIRPQVSLHRGIPALPLEVRVSQ